MSPLYNVKLNYQTSLSTLQFGNHWSLRATRVFLLCACHCSIQCCAYTAHTYILYYYTKLANFTLKYYILYSILVFLTLIADGRCVMFWCVYIFILIGNSHLVNTSTVHSQRLCVLLCSCRYHIFVFSTLYYLLFFKYKLMIFRSYTVLIHTDAYILWLIQILILIYNVYA